MSDVTDFMNAAPNTVRTAQDSLYGGADRMLAAQKAYYDNSKLQQLLPFVAPKESAMTSQEQTKAQYAPQIANADINSKNAKTQQTAQQTQYIAAQASNLGQEQWTKFFSSLPDYAKASAADARMQALNSNPALGGTMTGSFQPSLSSPQQSQFVPQQNGQMSQQQSGQMPQMSQSDIAAVQQVTPSAMVAGGGNAPPQMSAPVDFSQIPQQYQQNQMPAQSAMTGGQPMPQQQASQQYGQQPGQQNATQSNMANNLLPMTSGMKNQADLAQGLAVGDAGMRTAYFNNKNASNSIDAINDLTFNTPEVLTQYSGIAGKQKYEYDKARSALNKSPVSPAFSAMQQMEDTFSNITPDALSKAYTGGATIGSVGDMASILKKGFSPGATAAQNLNAQTTLKNLQAADQQSKAKVGGQVSSQDFEKTFGVPVDHDFSKDPIVPKMTRSQAADFLKSLTPDNRSKYRTGILNMLQQTGQAGGSNG